MVTSRCHVTLRDASCVSLSMDAFSAAIDAFSIGRYVRLIRRVTRRRWRFPKSFDVA